MTPTDVMVGSHDYRLVALSVLISIMAAYAARNLAERTGAAHGRPWIAWLFGGAITDGIAIWSMHYTAMLGYSLPIPILYNWPTVLLSLLVGIIGSAATLLVVSQSKIRWPRALAASIFLGAVGISGMHYTAMAAMRQQAMHEYSPALVTLSVVLAIITSLAALLVTFVFRNGQRHARSFRNHGGAILRGSANPIMHYTAMAAISFIRSDTAMDSSHTVSISSIGVIGISIVPVMILTVALLTTLADRLQKQRALFGELFEQAPEAVALIDANGRPNQ